MKEQNEIELQSYFLGLGEDMFAWSLTAISLYGAYLNVRKKWMGFLLWAIVDVLWAIYDWYIGEYAQAFLFLCYFYLAAWGLKSWFQEKTN